MGDVLKGTWIKIKPGVVYQGVDLSDKYGIVVDSESYVVVEIQNTKSRIKLLRTEIAEYLEDEPGMIFNQEENDWFFTF